MAKSHGGRLTALPAPLQGVNKGREGQYFRRNEQDKGRGALREQRIRKNRNRQVEKWRTIVCADIAADSSILDSRNARVYHTTGELLRPRTLELAACSPDRNSAKLVYTRDLVWMLSSTSAMELLSHSTVYTGSSPKMPLVTPCLVAHLLKNSGFPHEIFSLLSRRSTQVLSMCLPSPEQTPRLYRTEVSLDADLVDNDG